MACRLFRCQAIIWINSGLLSIRPQGSCFNDILLESKNISFTKMRLKMSVAKWGPFCLGLNMLKQPLLLFSVSLQEGLFLQESILTLSIDSFIPFKNHWTTRAEEPEIDWHLTFVFRISSEKWWPFCPGGDELKHRGVNKGVAILRTTFLNAFSWKKIIKLEFRRRRFRTIGTAMSR